MNRHFIQVTNGLLPVAMLGLLAIAFIAGQSRADLPGNVTSAAAPMHSASANIMRSVDMLKKADSLPQVVDTIMTLQPEIDLTISLLGRVSSGDAAAMRVGPGK